MLDKIKRSYQGGKRNGGGTGSRKFHQMQNFVKGMSIRWLIEDNYFVTVKLVCLIMPYEATDTHRKRYLEHSISMLGVLSDRKGVGEEYNSGHCRTEKLLTDTSCRKRKRLESDILTCVCFMNTLF